VGIVLIAITVAIIIFHGRGSDLEVSSEEIAAFPVTIIGGAEWENPETLIDGSELWGATADDEIGDLLDGEGWRRE